VARYGDGSSYGASVIYGIETIENTSRYGLGVYGTGILYGTSISDHYLWNININGKNISHRVQDLRTDRGRRYLLNSDASAFEIVDIGEANLVGINSDQVFSSMREGDPIYIELWDYTGTNLVTRLFTGEILELSFEGTRHNQIAYITATEKMEKIKEIPADLNEIKSSKRADELISDLLTFANWDGGSSLDIATNTVSKFWGDSSVSVFELIDQVAQSAIGVFFVNVDGEATFYDYSGTRTQHQIDETQLSRYIVIPLEYKNVRNDVSVFANNVIAVNETVFDSSQSFDVEAGADYNLIYDYENGAIAESPVLSYTSSDPDVTVTLVGSYGDEFEVNIKNVGAVTGQVTSISITADNLITQAIKLNSSDPTSVANFGKRSFIFNNPWLQNQVTAGVYMTAILDALKDGADYPRIEMIGREQQQFDYDLFDHVDLSIPTLDIDGIYRIGSIYHRWATENGTITETSIRLEPVIQ
jgi:hypothetical protein